MQNTPQHPNFFFGSVDEYMSLSLLLSRYSSSWPTHLDCDRCLVYSCLHTPRLCTSTHRHSVILLSNWKRKGWGGGGVEMTVTNAVAQHLQPISGQTALPLSSCRPDSWVWPGTGRTAGTCAVCFRVWLQRPAPSAEGKDVSAAPAD